MNHHQSKFDIGDVVSFSRSEYPNRQEPECFGRIEAVVFEANRVTYRIMNGVSRDGEGYSIPEEKVRARFCQEMNPGFVA